MMLIFYTNRETIRRSCALTFRVERKWWEFWKPAIVQIRFTD